MDQALLNSALQRANIHKQVRATQALDYVNELLQKQWHEKIKNKAKPLYIKDRKLVIAVLSSVLANEIRLRQHWLMAEINKKFGPDTVTKIQLEI